METGQDLGGREMRLDYLDYQIVYLEDTGDVSVYKNKREILYAHMSKFLSKENLIKNVSYIMALKERLSNGAECALM